MWLIGGRGLPISLGSAARIKLVVTGSHWAPGTPTAGCFFFKENPQKNMDDNVWGTPMTKAP